VGSVSFVGVTRFDKLIRFLIAEMDPLAPYARWLGKKLTVLDQSLGKIELSTSRLRSSRPLEGKLTDDWDSLPRAFAASYNLRIRGAEYAGSPAIMESFGRRMGEGEPVAR
jgi:hypothetical protein